MGSAERREREKLEVRTAILDGARSIMSERGFEGLTMRAVADRIEYSPAAIYKHFADREDLVRALCACDFYTFAQALLTGPGRPKSDDPLEGMRAIGHAYAEFGMRHPEQFRVMFMTPKPIDHDVIERGNPEQDAYAQLEAAVHAAQAAGRFMGLKPELVAQCAWSAVHGVVSLEIALATAKKKHIEFEPFRDRVDTVLEGMLAGMQALSDQRADEKVGHKAKPAKPSRGTAPHKRR